MKTTTFRLKGVVGMIVLCLAVACMILLIVSVDTLEHRPWIIYSSSIYSVEGDSVIRHVVIGGIDRTAKYDLFQCEENYHEVWGLETPKRCTILGSTVMTYSILATYDCFKTYIFREDGFTVKVSKAYLISGFDQNNQIIADLQNNLFVHNRTAIMFIGDDWNLTITIVESNTPITIQPPSIGLTEAQFNFNGQSDRDLAYHRVGDVETVLFDVRID